MLFKVLASYKNNDIITFLVSLLIMWMSIGAIKLTQKYFPIILGGRKYE